VSATGVAVQAYGSGTLPVLDASNITANSGWVQEGGGNTSCYTKTLSHTGAAGLYMSLWIDNVRPKWYATIAECQANPGSFTVGLSTGTSNVFTVHPFGSTNPNTDGKVYEYSARNYGCVTGGNSQVTAIRTKKQIHNNGSGSFGINNIVSDCVFEDGVKHNAYGSPGTTFNNCIAWKCDWPKRDGWIGIVLHSTVATGKTGTLRGCMSRIGIPQRDYGIAQGQATTAFYAHTAGASTDDNWDTINYFDCSSSGAESAFSVGDTNILNVERCFSEDAGSPFSLFAQNNNLIDGWATNPAGRQIQRLVSISSTSGANTVIDGLRFYTTLANDGDIYTTANGGTLNMGNSAIVRGPGNGSPHYLFRSEGDKVVNLGGNIFHFDVSNGGAYLTSKNNSLWNNNVITGTDQGNFIINTVEYETYPLFVTGVPALALGTYLDTNPQMVNPANGDFHVIPGTQSSLINAGCLRFPNYTTVPSDAAIGAM
jgi:hypothetical protein